MTSISCLVCLFHLTFEVEISIPVSVLGTVSVALGLLLAFRVNTAYDRYWEGRKLIQTVTATIRNVARQVWINIPEETEQDHLEKMRCVKLLLAFFVATKHHLRHEYGTHYYDLEVLLPPKWEPASVQKNKASEEQQEDVANGKKGKNSTVPKKAMSITLESNGDDTRSVDGSPQNVPHKMRIFSKAPALLVSLTDSIKPESHGGYMESDDPTHISNVRRSLVDQEFPNSDVSHMSTAYLKSTMPGSELNHTISEEEEQNVHLLDEGVNLPPVEAVDDNVPSGSRGVNNAGDHIRNRFRQHRQYKKRNLDHSEFTSEEDLPYQGDSDLSLPLEILFRVALYINQAKAANKIESTLVSVTTSSIDILVNSLTAFERIVHTPIPKAYNIHLKQAVVLYIFFLPFALVDTLGWLVAPIVAIVSFTLFGIEAIGAEIENPFGYDDNDLPLNRYCDELKKEVEYIIYHIPTHSTSILLDGQ
ncbi:Bestrophin, RFP-TM, chloride channel-domain-containing protein [Mucor mucedo]|uniref:Bestrophin, RFP-TM, chloride channel-domain-containing protein n=1 Tax=Mucor mucedo TaxID=29922 RepID=UPI00221E6CED|nr:Bestrophin, RFP-TM, chloride channel-domain-containing protein [Mucor mucedo]KAI7893730.1 Bestrophin, RFP-TM, chloride channel-domain-containing protein [Mucor mucedo]